MKLMLRSGHQMAVRNQAGDTIVEVLICIAVISTVLVGAFIVAGHSTRAVQDSAEHTQGVQYVQTQVEALRTYVQSNAAADVASKLPINIAFCMDTTDTSQVVPIADPTNPPAHCVIHLDGATYNIVDRVTGPDDYDMSANWGTITGTTAHEDFLYRVYPQS